jgi:hypothetical protein
MEIDFGHLNPPPLCLRRPGALFIKTAPGPRKNFLLGFMGEVYVNENTGYNSVFDFLPVDVETLFILTFNS